MTASLDVGDNYQIEENSNGNLVVRDSTGTVVLKHEDGTQDIETNSFSTDNIDITGGSKGNVKSLYQHALGSDEAVGVYSQFTDGVSTTSTVILDKPDDAFGEDELGNVLAADCKVLLIEQGSPSRYKMDEVSVVYFDEAVVDETLVRSGSFNTTYSVDSRQLKLSMGSTTVNSVVIAHGLSTTS